MNAPRALTLCLLLLLGPAPAGAATEGVTAKTVSYAAQPGGDGSAVEVRWEGDLRNEGVDPVRAAVVLTLRDEGGQVVQEHRLPPVELGRLETRRVETAFAVAPDAWARARSLRVGAEGQTLAAPPPPAEEPPSVEPRGAGDSGGEGKLARLQADLDDARDRASQLGRELGELSEKYREKSEDYADACAGDRPNATRQSTRCQRLQQQLDDLRKETTRASEKRERADKAVGAAVERLERARQRSDGGR
ncbi:MAG: hypothetical protein ACYDA8_21785 [Deferrisomatales bacterium]